jgi:C-terminal processing protease CtpA/Prc
MFWCESGGRILVKNAWSAAASAGITPGMQVTAVDGVPVEKWLEAKIAERGDLMSFSTDHQAFFAACHWGLARDRGSPMKVELRTVDGKRKRANLTIRRAGTVPSGPAFPPEGLARTGRQSYGKTAQGFGYIHLRDAKSALPAQMDEMLGAIGDVPGLVLDCRANGGGAFDHGSFFGRFVPEGETFEVGSAGPNPYPGNVVVIIDAGVRSAGETLVGMLKESGRAYVIGDSPTAGMSSSKKDLPLPSGLFLLHYSVRSNGRNFNEGRGIEGIGIPPHEVVEYDPRDLAKGVDTMIRRAEELLADFPAKEIRYHPPR